MRILVAGLALAALVVLPGCAAADTPPADGVVVAFYGDSYTNGAGASDPANRWSSVISAERGWTEVNPSVSGLGFVNNRRVFGDGDLPSIVIDADPDIVIVAMGLNDNFSFPVAAGRIRLQITADLARIRAALPDARLVVVEPFWYTDERPASVETIIGWVRDAAGEVGADFIPDASHWLEGRPELMAVDGLHPNDAGYAVMTEHMDRALTALGL